MQERRHNILEFPSADVGSDMDDEPPTTWIQLDGIDLLVIADTAQRGHGMVKDWAAEENDDPKGRG